MANRIWTIGHSSLPIAAFVDLLEGHRIERVADVRRFPGSRAHPHFNPEPLERALAAAGIDYRTMPELGGRRKPRHDSANTVWRHPAFRGYADYMETPEFRGALSHLRQLALERRTAAMCSEALWWRCHRSLIADVLKADGIEVLHIFSDGHVVEHPYTSAAAIVDGKLQYGATAATASAGRRSSSKPARRRSTSARP
jgi:uncharacterized protein (DUF488 family)